MPFSGCSALNGVNPNLKKATTLVYKEKINLKVLDGISFQVLPSLLSQEELAKCSYFWRCCFTHSPLIFATQEANH